MCLANCKGTQSKEPVVTPESKVYPLTAGQTLILIDDNDVLKEWIVPEEPAYLIISQKKLIDLLDKIAELQEKSLD